MPSRLPPATGPSRHPNPRKQATGATQSKPAAPDTSFRLTETFKKRRTTLWAVGVAIIVGAGSILGAQLKERQQAKQRVATEARDVSGPQANTAAAAASTAATLDNTPSLDAGATSDMAGETKKNKSAGAGTGAVAAGTTHDQRQITFLEDRRGQLMKQKFELERKIDRVREKKKREEEVEGRRAAGITGER